MSQHYQSRMTSKGQVTIPAELRKALGLKSGDRVEFVQENGSVRVRRAESIVERVAGSFRISSAPLDPDEIREIVETEVAEDVVRRMNESR